MSEAATAVIPADATRERNDYLSATDDGKRYWLRRAA